LAGILANQEKMESAQRILSIAKSVLVPSNATKVINTQTWNNAMNGFVKGGDLEQAERILLLLEKSYEKNQNDLAPTVASYSIVMDGWAKQNNVAKAQDIFDRMQRMYQEHGNTDARPNAYPYVTMIHMYARQRDRPEYAAKAESLLFEMHDKYTTGNYPDLKPNTQLITSCLDAWQKSGASNSGERAEALLEWMMEQSKNDPDLAPNRYTFCGTFVFVLMVNS